MFQSSSRELLTDLVTHYASVIYRQRKLYMFSSDQPGELISCDLEDLGGGDVHVAAILLAPISPRDGEREALTEVGGANT